MAAVARLAALAALAAAGAGCRRESSRSRLEPPAVGSAGSGSAPSWPASRQRGEVPSKLPAAPRLVAIGDIHGDLAAARAALRTGGVIDADDHWSGGTATVVQTGDILDRGDDEQAIVDLFE